MTLSPSKSFDHLNKKQKEAVTAPRRPVLMIAGPGTGKTRTLIARIAYQISRYQIPPEQILALTFSNKAAGEIKWRLQDHLKDAADKVRTGTFHSFCFDVLKRYHQAAGLHKYFSICDDSYQRRLVSGIIAKRTREQPDRKARSVLLAFSNHILKNKTLPPFSAAVFDEYQAHLEKHRLIDYDQLLVKTWQLFEKHRDILEQYRFLNQAVLVDEFQDTDPIQYAIVKILAEKHRNIFVVADDDQSIYAWRGANPDNIRTYMQDFEIESPIFLVRNYRSGKTIMEAAQLIVRDTDRVEPSKSLVSREDEEARVQAHFFENEAEELHFIAQKIRDWYVNHPLNYSDLALIYPRHKMGDRLAAYLIDQRIPHQLAAGRNLTDHPMMKKIISYLKLIRDPMDSLVLEDLCEMELGAPITRQIQRQRDRQNVPFKTALNAYSKQSNLNYDIRNQLQTFVGNIANLINLKSFYGFTQLIEEIIRSSTEFSYSVLQKHLKNLGDITIPDSENKLHKDTVIWVYHSEEKVAFLACEMLKQVYKQKVLIFDREQAIHIKGRDWIVLLEALALDDLSATLIPVFKYRDERRKGSLSALFRWQQKEMQKLIPPMFTEYVIFDLETTGRDVERCGIVEIAAVKVKNDQIVDEFQSLVNPQMPIEKEARQIHKITEADIKDAPVIEDIWDSFRAFIGDALLIAHNGYAFDFKIIDRINRQLERPKLAGRRYDTLVLARKIYYAQRNSIDALADRFKLHAGVRHRALDDVKVLYRIFREMQKELNNRQEKTAGEDLTEYVALCNMVENTLRSTEDRIFFTAGVRKLLSPWSRILKQYVKQFKMDIEEVRSNLEKVAARTRTAVSPYNTDEDFSRQVLRSAKSYEHLEVDEAIAEFLSYIALLNPQDALEAVDAVSLLTFHAAKGLEFEHVIILGMEDDYMPNFFAYKNDAEDERSVVKKIEEQKRLLYVGMTRAKKEVIFTLVRNREGRRQKSSPFLDEIRQRLQIFRPS